MQNNESKSMNGHIEDYLDYYCKLPHSPGFAILLKGEWGCGKTWFIGKYRNKLNLEAKKSLYISLYGMTCFSEIENEFYRQLHPVLSSEGMAIAGKVFQGLLKTSLKIDLNQDGNDDGNVMLQIPQIEIPESFKRADESILIFDDLERCKIDINNILGYINYFVEHQNLKVILLANEEKLLADDNYKNIREKLIGKAFNVNCDLHGALNSYIKKIDCSEIEKFLLDNSILIEEIYKKTEYNNLRSLNQVILDFERIYCKLPERAKSESKLLQEILQFLMAFSIEIKRGTLLPNEIGKLELNYSSEITKQARRNVDARRQNISNSSVSTINTDKPNNLEKIFDTYSFLNLLLYQPLPNLNWWQIFFDRGIIDTVQLEESILNSKYFQDENTPDWIRLWHFYDTDISDDEYKTLLSKVESDYANRKFLEEGEIIHITGVFLNLSNNGLYSKSKQDLLQEAKAYIDDLVSSNRLDLNLSSPRDTSSLYSLSGYKGLGYQGIELEEFKEFHSYIKSSRQAALEQKLPELGLKLLKIMQNDKWQFHRMICVNNFSDYQEWDRVYCRVPIFKYIDVQKFFKTFLSINFDLQGASLYALVERYKVSDSYTSLKEELIWLEQFQALLLNEIDSRKGKISSYRLNLLNKEYLEKALKELGAS